MGGIHGRCGHRVVGLGCVGRWCCWLFGVAVVGCCVGSGVAMLGGYMYRWVGVGFVGWWLIGGGVGLVRVWHGEITIGV